MTGFEVDLPAGRTRVSALVQAPADPVAVVLLAHGAGAGMEHPFLTGLADALEQARFAVVRFVFPYLEAGRRMPGPAAHATATWIAAMRDAERRFPGLPVIAAGKSYGGRMASMAAAEGLIAPAGLVYLGYPLHPPGAPEKLRAAHLPAITAPQLFVEGTRDPFLQPLEQFAEVVAHCQLAEVVWIEGGGHSFDVAGTKRPAYEIGASLAGPVADWVARQGIA